MTDTPDHSAHVYLSTACFHGECDQCRRTCKYCPAECVCSLCDHSVMPTYEQYDIGELIEFQEPRSDRWVEATVVGHDEFGRPLVDVPRHLTPYNPDPSRLRRIT